MYRSICVITLWMVFVNIVISDRHENVKRKCALEVGLHSTNFLSHINDDERVDMVFKCYMTCMYIGNGMLAPDGRMRLDMMNKYISLDWPERNELLADWQSCGTQSLASDRVEKCDVGFAFAQCFSQNITDRIYLARYNAKRRKKN